MPFPFLTEQTTPKVGRYYYVKCARMTTREHEFGHHIPVIGEAHKDLQFSVNFEHLHVDGRFVTLETPYIYVGKEGRTNQIISTQHIDHTGYAFKCIDWIPLKCVRKVTGISPPARDFSSHYSKWYDTMIGKSCAGKKCPHMGTTMHCRDGKWECPLHHLIGDPATEKIIDYDTRPPEVKSFTQFLKKALT